MNWYQVKNRGNFTNLVIMTVTNENDIELYSEMVVTPGIILTQGEPASVNLNVINNGSSTFKGIYDVSLFNLDGSLAQEFDVVYENNGLPSGYVYLSPFLTFNTDEINVEPGTYLLAILHNPNNSGWQLTGSTYYQNPIRVTVIEPGFNPDSYENNNTAGQAYNLPVSFSGDIATKNTEGSNIDVADDNDFYKISLPSGYNYSIKPRLHDAYDSGNGIIYSVDGLFSYSTDGSNVTYHLPLVNSGEDFSRYPKLQVSPSIPYTLFPRYIPGFIQSLLLIRKSPIR